MIEDGSCIVCSLTTSATTTGYNSQHRIDDEVCAATF
ncbi:unnamed protein product [Musa hybrid cultivar]